MPIPGFVIRSDTKTGTKAKTGNNMAGRRQ